MANEQTFRKIFTSVKLFCGTLFANLTELADI